MMHIDMVATGRVTAHAMAVPHGSNMTIEIGEVIFSIFVPVTLEEGEKLTYESLNFTGRLKCGAIQLPRDGGVFLITELGKSFTVTYHQKSRLEGIKLVAIAA